MSNPAPALPDPLPAPKGGVFALGNFDGVHLGHQAVVKAAIDKARGMGIPARVLTFEPHPRSIFKPHIPPFRLTPGPAKVRFLSALGVDDVIVRAFTPEFSKVGAPEFVDQVLLADCGAQHIVVGFDFVFGHARGGHIRNLREWLAPHGVGVTEVTPFRDAEGHVMSSSRTREALQQGDLRTAEHFLGRPWSIAGTVERGARRGHEMSVPTANIPLGEYLRPKFGVYAVQAGRVPPTLLRSSGGPEPRPAEALAKAGGEPKHWQGVANIGVRPTVGGDRELLEFHLFDFYEDIYGQEWEVELIHFLRPERRFPDMDALREQINQDIEQAKARLAFHAFGR